MRNWHTKDYPTGASRASGGTHEPSCPVMPVINATFRPGSERCGSARGLTEAAAPSFSMQIRFLARSSISALALSITAARASGRTMWHRPWGEQRGRLPAGVGERERRSARPAAAPRDVSRIAVRGYAPPARYAVDPPGRRARPRPARTPAITVRDEEIRNTINYLY